MSLSIIYPDVFPPSIGRDIHDEMFRRVEAALAMDEERDEQIESLADQLDGRQRPVHDSRIGTDACELEDPLTAEHFYDVLSNVIPGWERAQLCMVDAENPEDSKIARKVEAWLNSKATDAGIRQALYKMFFYANSGMFGVCRILWVDETIRNTNDQTIVQIYSGVRFHVPHPTDFHLYPASARDPETALACIERMELTREDLLDGIESLGLDEDCVMECIREPAASAPDDEVPINDNQLDAPYICYYVVGRVPLLVDLEGSLRIPKDMRGVDYEWLLCPDRRAVLMCRPYRYARRPWVVANAIIRPDSYLGTSTVELLTPLQDEATNLLRAYMDSVNIAAIPAMVMPERLARKFGNQRVYPGAQLLVEHDMDELRPLIWDMNGLAAMENAWSAIAVRAAGLASSQGRPTMGAGKVRKAAEVNAAEQQVSAKFDLIFTCVRQAIEQIFKVMIVMYAHEAYEGGQDIDADLLWRPWRFTATATTESANPRLRAEQTARKNAIQNEYLLGIMKLPPEYRAMKYHAAYSMLMDEGERQPELWLGPEPQSYEDAVADQIAQEVQGGLGEAGKFGDMAGGAPALPAGGDTGGIPQTGFQGPVERVG